MLSNTTVILLRFVHIVMGSLWVGGAVMVARIILPSVMAVGPAAGPVMDQIGRVRKLPIYLMMLMVFTILSGVILMWHVSGGFSHDWFLSHTGHGIMIGATAALVAAIVGVTVSMPTGKKLTALVTTLKSSGAPPTPEQSEQMGRLQKKLLGAARLAAVFLMVAVGLMAIARYL